MTKTFTNEHRTQVITADLGHIRRLVATLKVHHRDTRSINLIGTALKVIAGTPDFNWEQIKFNQEQLINAEEGQSELNIKFQKRVNAITNSMNQIQKVDRKKGHIF